MVSKVEKLQCGCEKNTGTTKTAGSATESCPLYACEPTGMGVKCSHKESGERAYALDMLKPPNHNNSEQVLQVVSLSSQPEIVTIALSGECQQKHGCKTDSSSDASRHRRSNPDHCCPSVAINGHNANVDQTSPVKVEVSAVSKPPTDEGLLGYIKYYLIPDFEPTIYAVQSKKCGGNARFKAKIHAFPAFSANGGIKIGYEPPAPSDKMEMNQKKGFINKLTKGSWNFTGLIACEMDGHKWEVKTKPKQDQDEKKSDAFANILGMFDQILPFLSAAAGESDKLQSDPKKMISTRLSKPQITFNTNTKLVECKNDYRVDLDSTLKLGLALLDMDLTLNLIPLLLKATGPYGVIIQEIIDIAAKGVGTENVNVSAIVKMELTVNGKAGGDIKVVKKPKKEWDFETLTIKAGVGFTAKGKIEGKAKAFYVVVASGLEVALSSKNDMGTPSMFSGEYTPIHGENHPTLGGQLTFNGLAVYLTTYIEFGAESAKDKRDQDQDPTAIDPMVPKPKKETSVKDKHEYKTKYVFIEPFSFPEVKSTGEGTQSQASLTSLLSN